MNQANHTSTRPESILSRIGQRQEGFSMISAIMALMVGTLLSLAAWATAQSDINFTSQDRWSRLAYQRAQSGVSDYVQHLSEDTGFWKACDEPDGFTGDGIGFTALNDTDFGTLNHPKRRWLPMSSAGSTDDLSYNAQYSIDILPAAGSTICKPSATAGDRIIDPNSGTFKVLVTGRAGPLVPSDLTGDDIEEWRGKNWKRVSIVAEFRRSGFLDYAYFTDHEGVDPRLQGNNPECWGMYEDDPDYLPAMGIRTEPPLPGRYREGISGGTCVELEFAQSDQIKGPVHTNDGMLLDSSTSTTAGPKFGNDGKGDRIEVYDNGKKHPTQDKGKCPFRIDHADLGPPPVNQTPSNCRWDMRRGAGTTLLTGPRAQHLDLPEDNEDLKLYASESGPPEEQGYSFYGKTTITLKANGKFDVVSNRRTANDLDYPASGVIYVFNDGVTACQSDPYNKTYATSIPANCALAEVQGSYNKSLTIGSEADVVVTGNLQRSNSQTAVLGLIANQYVRVRHYARGGQNNYRLSGSCRSDGVGNTTPAVTNIQAAILTLNRSFTYDGYMCGSNNGFLTTFGAVAQRWRGGVGSGVSGTTTSCSGGSGYCKNYNYDYALKSQTPPHFLSPSAASWKVIRMRQILPACECGPTS